MFNLIVDIHVMVNWQQSKKGIHWPVSHDCNVSSSVQLIEVMWFFTLSADQLLVLIIFLFVGSITVFYINNAKEAI